MRTMTIMDVINYEYPGQIAEGNIGFSYISPEEIRIIRWDVPGCEKPSEEDLKNKIPGYQLRFDLDTFNTIVLGALSQFLDKIAQSRQYDSALSCVSYVNSGVKKWDDEAVAFSQYRDIVFTYIEQEYKRMQDGQRSIPSFKELKDELPVISWPTPIQG